jgi:CheY-like chemotaxis protein
MTLQIQDALLLMLLTGAAGLVLGGGLSGLLKNLWLSRRGVSVREPAPSPQARAAAAAIRHAKVNAKAKPAAHKPPAPVVPALPHAADLLLVDDSAVARVKLRKLFEPAGYQVHLANDGVEALALLQKGRYALMITDLEMPNMDGIELIRTCKTQPQTASMPILAITGHDHLRAKFNECRDIAGIHRKPWIDDILLSHVAALVTRREAHGSSRVAALVD